jgi:secreted Zn-dependent insulinase-like peptidase
VRAGVGRDGEVHNTEYYLFQLEIDLTSQGLNAAPGMGLAVAQLLFDYIAMLKESGPQAWIWDEMKALKEMSFRCDAAAAISRLLTTSSALWYSTVARRGMSDFLLLS